MQEQKKGFPLVSVPVISYNSSRFIIEALESIKTQTYPNLELIISDDCSTDNTLELCRSWLNENSNRFVRTEIICAPQNRGISANLNVALDHCSGFWIKGIAADDIMLPNCIESLVNYCDSVGCWISCGKVIPFGNEMGTNADSSFWGKKYEILRKLNNSGEQYLELLKDNFIPAASVIVKKDDFMKYGGYDEEIPLLEDWPMWLRITGSGEKIYFCDEDVVKYRLSSNSVRFNYRFAYSVYLFRYKYIIHNKFLYSFLRNQPSLQKQSFYSRVVYRLLSLFSSHNHS